MSICIEYSPLVKDHYITRQTRIRFWHSHAHLQIVEPENVHDHLASTPSPVRSKNDKFHRHFLHIRFPVIFGEFMYERADCIISHLCCVVCRHTDVLPHVHVCWQLFNNWKEFLDKYACSRKRREKTCGMFWFLLTISWRSSLFYNRGIVICFISKYNLSLHLFEHAHGPVTKYV